MPETILYDEYAGGADYTDGKYEHGVHVILGRWDPDISQLPRHYTLQVRVMIDRNIVVDTLEIRKYSYLQGDANEIRNAITRFDQLLDSYPEIEMQEV